MWGVNHLMAKTRRKPITFRELVHEETRTPTEIAKAAGISRSYIYDLMSGERTSPKPWVVNRLAGALGYRFDSAFVEKCLKKTAREG